MKGGFEVGSYKENESTYLGMKISKAHNENFDGAISGPNKYDEEVNHIGIPHDRTRASGEPLAEAGLSIFLSGIGKSMMAARIGRPGAIYDASAAAQTLSWGGCSIRWLGMKISPKNEENGDFQKERENVCSVAGHVLQFLYKQKQPNVN